MNKLRQRIEEIIFTWEGHGTTPPYASSKDLVDKLEALIEEEKMKQHLETLENT